ncbi:hypothetical protein CEP53_012205 [Fusarium sp. AF-6]|nr:hypothetical protein CEP53_012205 [Fusarium sp. AF-6]
MLQPRLLFFTLLALNLQGGQASLPCRCTPTEPCWPSDDAWKTLNASIDGRLIRTAPPASVCYHSEPNYDAEECDLVLKGWLKPSFHSGDPTSIHSPALANNSCNPIFKNGTSVAGDTLAGGRGCSLDVYSPYVVNATEAAHVQAALKFVNKWNLRVSIKNTGHISKTALYGSLSIWTHYMKQVEFHKDFQSTCQISPPQTAFTVGAGLQDEEIFHAAAEYGMAVVGGTNSDAGLVGWATGGGHGYLTSEFGMGADSIIQAVVVTADGKVLTTNECQNADLLWAIRGGGGGTFGVITELTVKAHPMPQATTLLLNVEKKTNCTSCWWDLMAELHALLPGLKRQGLQGYYTIGGAPSWISVFDALPTEGSAGGGGAASASRLLPESALTDDVEKLARVLELIGPSDEASKAGVSNPRIADSMTASSVAVDNALNPAWRDTVVHLIAKESWKDSLPYTQANAALDDMTNVEGAALRSLAPDSGTYFNEADALEPDWQRAFWGHNYEKLLDIKHKYDPDRVFWCKKCVGSEAWVEQLDGELCRIAYGLLAVQS